MKSKHISTGLIWLYEAPVSKIDEIWGPESSILGAGAPKITQLHPEDSPLSTKMGSYQ